MSDVRIAVPAELFAPAESSHFQGEVSLPVVEAGPDTFRFAEPLQWQVDITNTGEALLVAGTVSGEARAECARCLEEFPLSVEGDIEGYFLLDETKAAPQDMDDDEFDVLPASHEIDLEPLIIAALLVEFPLVPLCDDDCKGLCPHCGANLNDGPCSCTTQTPEQEVPTMSDGRPSPFAALKGITFEEDEQS